MIGLRSNKHLKDCECYLLTHPLLYCEGKVWLSMIEMKFLDSGLNVIVNYKLLRLTSLFLALSLLFYCFDAICLHHVIVNSSYTKSN